MERADSDAAAPRVRTDLGEMLSGYRAAATATVDLAAAELQLAASTAVLLIVLAIATALLLTSTWILGMLAIASVIAGAGDWPMALSAVAAANLLGAFVAWLWMRAAAPNMTFRELRALIGGRAASDMTECEGQ